MSVRGYYEAYWSERGQQPRESVNPALATLFQDHIRAGADCIDVGCGDGGRAGAWLAANGASYVGVDVSEAAVSAARARGLRAIRIDDAGELPFPSDSFDAAVCVEVLEHLFAPDATVREIRRVLRPGGRLIATVPNVAFWRWRLDLALLGRWNPLGDALSTEEPWRDPHIRFFQPATLVRMIEACGLEVVDRGGWNDVPSLQFVPGLGRRLSPPRERAAPARLQRRLPSLLALRAFAVARKP